MSMRRSRLRVTPNVGSRPAPGIKKEPTTTDKPKEEPKVEAEKTDVSKDAVYPATIASSVAAPSPQKTSASETPTAEKAPELSEKPGEIKNSTTDAGTKTPASGRRSRIKPQVKLPLGKPGGGRTSSAPIERTPAGGKDIRETADKSKLTEKPSVISSEYVDTTDSHKASTLKEDDNSIIVVFTEDSADASGSIEHVVKSSTVPPPENSSSDKVDQPQQPERGASASPGPGAAVRRGRFPKAKPNIAGAEKRRSRVVSVSEPDETPAAKKPKGGSVLPSSTATPTPTESPMQPPPPQKVPEDKSSKVTETPEIPKKSKRKSTTMKLETLVSENRNKLTIGDLIHMNPTINVMKRYRTGENDAPPTPGASNDGSRASTPSIPDDTASVRSDPLSDPPEIMDAEDGSEEAMAPRVMIGPDGSIIIDDKSLLIANPAHEVDTNITQGQVIVDNDNYDPSFYYKKRSRGKLWGAKETVKFYLAMNAVGTDFSLMCSLFPKRARIDLKRKFKMEEKKHKDLVDRALTERHHLDMSIFDSLSEDDDKETAASKKTGKKGIKEAVSETLSEEAKQRSKKQSKKPRAPKKEPKNPKPKKAAKTKKRTKKSKSQYFDESEESETEAATSAKDADAKDDKGEEGSKNSDDDEFEEEKIVPKITRSGRLPKEARRFQCEDFEKRKRTDSLSSLSKFAPLVNISPGLVPEGGMIEDHESGQRLLLVKSPPPVGTPGRKDAASSEFVHVYLLSPSISRRGENELKSPQGSKENMFFQSPPDRSKDHENRSDTTVQCKIVGNNITVEDSNTPIPSNILQVTSETSSTSSPHGQHFLSPSRTPVIGSCSTPQSVIKKEERPTPENKSASVHSVSSPGLYNEPKDEFANVTSPAGSLRSVGTPVRTREMDHCYISDGSGQSASPAQNIIEILPATDEVSQSFDSTQITTFMTETGEVLEILIDPSILNLNDDQDSDV